jgi:hypothetical protein
LLNQRRRRLNAFWETLLTKMMTKASLAYDDENEYEDDCHCIVY